MISRHLAGRLPAMAASDGLLCSCSVDSSVDSDSAMAMKSRDWSSSADTHYQIDLRRSSRLSVRIIRLFQGRPSLRG